jgi:formamidopyrimidine-DNA glycosylase
LPELPEIEHLKRSLEPYLTGARVTEVSLARRDVVRSKNGAEPRDLLRSAVVDRLERHGKQLAVVTRDDRVLVIHLGMSGQLRYVAARRRLPVTDHVHCVWRLRGPRGHAGRLLFRDPRRFGGLWAYPSTETLRRQRWSRLGPDALTIRAAILRERLAGTRRSIKSALMDQTLVAGLGNIYVDEALFAARTHPLSCARDVEPPHVGNLAAAVRRILRVAIESGGSTLRDYVDAAGRKGSHVQRHRVYGRGGEPCMRCGKPLAVYEVTQRTTVACDRCQRRWGS